MVAIITEIHRDMSIGEAMTTGIILTDHMSAAVIIIIASITIGRKAIETTIENRRAGSIKSPLITEYFLSKGFFILYNLRSSTCFAPFVAWRIPNRSFYRCGRCQQ